MKQTYQVSEFHMDWLKDYIKTINKRAIKLGQKEITYKVLDEKFAKVSIDEVAEGQLIEHTATTKVYTVEVEAEPVGVEGYRFVASIEHGYENGNIVHAVDDVAIPNKYYTADGICEHCHTNRRRKITVILMNDKGQFIQIGRSCLKDYIGYNVDNQLKYMDLINVMLEEMSEHWGNCGGSGYVPYINLAEYLTFVEKEINEHGWASKSSVARIEQSTAYNAELSMTLWENKHPDEEVTPSGFVQEAIEWIRSIENTDNDYMNNLKTMCMNDYVRVKDEGYVASLLNTYQKALEIKKKKELEAKQNGNSQYVGEIGKRTIFNVIYTRHFSYDTEFGTMRIYNFLDSNGNVIIWKTSNFLEVKAGDSIKLKGTVKEHTEYNGTKQTILSRCAVM